MKKSLFFLATAALVLASCSNDVTISENTVPAGSNAQQEIAFAPLSNTPKYAIRRAAVDGTTFPTTSTMQVAAYDVTNTRDFFDATTFSHDDGTIWKGGKYWPLSAAYINFLAYANFNGTAGSETDGATWAVAPATAKASGVTLVMTDNSTAQKDLMYAIGNGEVTQTANALSFPTNVPMAFKHAQAWIKFNVKAADAASTAITVNSITLNNAVFAGTYTITHTAYNARTGQSVAGAWSALGTPKNVAVPGWSAAALTTGGADVANGLMIVPDDAATADFASFTINYSYDGKTYDFTYTPETKTIDQAHSYTYNITFTLHEIKVAATVADWENTNIPVAIP